ISPASTTIAGLINSLKIVQKRPEDVKVVLLGVGSAGIACAYTMMKFGVQHIIGFDRAGAMYEGRPDGMNPAQAKFASVTNRERFSGTMEETLRGADVFLGVSGPRMLTVEAVESMGPDAIVMALANPEPEIMPDLIQDKARIIATGRSDYPNQLNNVLCFPGLFRGVFDASARSITEEMKIAAARAIAETIPDDQLSEDYILPSVFNLEVAPRVAAAVAAEAIRTGNVRSTGARIFI
ncbi:MAG: NAD-dependent malic enzyme, partial [Chloroflexota bacterium]